MDEWLQRERARDAKARVGRKAAKRAMENAEIDARGAATSAAADDNEDDDEPRGLFRRRRKAAPEVERPTKVAVSTKKASTDKASMEELSESDRDVALAAQAWAATKLDGATKRANGRAAPAARRRKSSDLYDDDDDDDDEEVGGYSRFDDNDDDDDDDLYVRAPPRRRAPRRGRLAAAYDDFDDEVDDDDDDDEMWGARRRGSGSALARRRRSSTPAPYGSRSAYVEGRLRTLERRVVERVEELEEAEAELVERRRDTIGELRALREQIEESGEVVPEDSDDAAVETRGPRHKCRVLLARSGELAERRMRTWAALDEAEGRLGEIGVARRTLRARGLSGLYALVEKREVSRSLRTFLEKLF